MVPVVVVWADYEGKMEMGRSWRRGKSGVEKGMRHRDGGAEGLL